MKKNNSILYLIIVLLTSIFLLGPAINILNLEEEDSNLTTETNIVKDWTIMVYLDADNNLDSYGVDDLNEMEEGLTSKTDINVIVLLDREYKHSKTYEVEPDTSSSIVSTVLTTGFASELDMGDPTTLQDFIEFSIDNYPADNYVLDLWNHGSGWPGICYDDTSGNSHLTLGEIKTVLANIYSTKSVKINITAMDACLMGMLEVAYSIEDYTDILVASEETIPGDGFPYDTILSNLVSNPTQSIYSFASNIVDLYHDSYRHYSDTTLSAINLSSGVFSTLQTAFDNFTLDMIQEASVSKLNYDSAKSICQKFTEPAFIDLYDYTDELINIDSKFSVNGTNLLNAINDSVINNKQRGMPGAYGLSIYFPTETAYSTASMTYNALSISNSYWDEFLTAFYTDYDIDLSLTSYTFNDTIGGNNNSIIDSGEAINLSITLKNSGAMNATSVNGSLAVHSPDPSNITIKTPIKQFGNISSGDIKSRVFNFNVSADLENGTIVMLDFNVNASFSGGILLKSYRISFVLGYDVLLGGASISEALEIASGSFIGILPGPSTTDAGSAYFKINMSYGKALNLNLTAFDESTDFDIYIYDPDGNFVSAALSSSYPDMSGTYARKTGYHYIRMYPYNGTGLYRLNATVCDEAYEDGRLFGTAFTINTSGTFNGSTDANSEYPDIFYRYWVDSGAYLNIRLIGDYDTDFDLYLYSESFEELDYSLRIDYPESIKYWITDTGYIYIIVSPWEGSGNYSLSVTIEEKPPIPGFRFDFLFITILFTVGLFFMSRKFLKIKFKRIKM
ncbi:MAG: hypothetical protein EU549_00665 [Promethearchaeota archaeon]|nr:MAG: hypothetical protein EU549_00665 [Candidatus Lokiarchaeota archaeon]